MAYSYGWRGPDIVTNGLHLYFDAASPNSYYVPENNTPTTWRDMSGNNWHGSITASYIPASQSFGFNGTDQTITINSEATLAGKDQVTINLWWKPLSISAGVDKRMFYEETSSDTFTRIGIEQDNTSIQMKWRVAAQDPAGTGGTLSSTAFINSGNVGTFFYITGVYDAIADRQIIYVNGVQNAIATTAITALGTSTTRGLSFGSALDWATFYNQCQIGAAHIYTRALTATEILKNYNATKTRFTL
jgi:hypothetical protein